MARFQVSLGVRVDPELLDQVDRVANECHLGRSEWVRGVLVDAIKAHTLKSKRIASMANYSGEPDL